MALADLKLEDVDDRKLSEEDVGDVADEMEDVALHYGAIGIALRIKPSVVEIIEKSNPYDVKKGLREVLKEWLNENYIKHKVTTEPKWPCWRKVVEVVGKSSAGNHRALAKKIAARHPFIANACPASGPEREARMGDVNATTHQEVSAPTEDVTLSPDQDATEPSHTPTQSLVTTCSEQRHQHLHESSSAPLVGQLLTPSHFKTEHPKRSDTVPSAVSSNQIRAASNSITSSRSGVHTRQFDRQRSPIKELEKDMASMNVTQPPPSSNAQASYRGRPPTLSSAGVSSTQPQSSYPPVGGNRTEQYPLESMSHNDYPPQQVPTQQVHHNSPPAVPGPGNELAGVGTPHRQAEVPSGTQPTEQAAASQMLIAPGGAVQKSYSSDNDIDSPSKTAQNFPPNIQPPFEGAAHPHQSFNKPPPGGNRHQSLQSSSPRRSRSPEAHSITPTHTQHQCQASPVPGALYNPNPLHSGAQIPLSEAHQYTPQESVREAAVSSPSPAQAPPTNTPLAQGGSSQGSTGGRRLKYGKGEKSPPASRNDPSSERSGNTQHHPVSSATTGGHEHTHTSGPPHQAQAPGTSHDRMTPPTAVAMGSGQYQPPTGHSQYQPPHSNAAQPFAGSWHGQPGSCNPSQHPSGQQSGHMVPPSSGYPANPPYLAMSSIPPTQVPYMAGMPPTQVPHRYYPAGIPPTQGPYSYYPSVGMPPTQGPHPQHPPGLPPTQGQLYWVPPGPHGYYPTPWPYQPYEWRPHQQNMPPQPPITPLASQNFAPPTASQSQFGAVLEANDSESEEISEGSVAGTPQEVSSHDKGKLCSGETVLRYESVKPHPTIDQDIGKRRQDAMVSNIYKAYSREVKFNKIGLSYSHEIISPDRPEEGARPPENVYPMTSSPHGLAVIINNSTFRRHDVREGTHVDSKDLVLTFQYLGYTVEEYTNLTSHQITRLFDEIRFKDHSDYDSFICCILSHGKNNYVYGSDSKKVAVKNLSYKLSCGPCRTLAGKPKLFFIQACRGSFTTGGVQTDSSQDDSEDECRLLPPPDPNSPEEEPVVTDANIACVSDFFVGYSTSADYVSYRDPQRGSWFIWELCQALCSSSTCKPLRDMMDTVHDHVNTVYSSLGDKQAPEYLSSLRKKVFFWQ